MPGFGAAESEIVLEMTIRSQSCDSPVLRDDYVATTRTYAVTRIPLSAAHEYNETDRHVRAHLRGNRFPPDVSTMVLIDTYG